MYPNMSKRMAGESKFGGETIILKGLRIAAATGALVLGLMNVSQAGAQSAQAGGAALPSFEVASIKPDHSDDGRMMFRNTPGKFTVANASVKFLIEFAYNIKDFQLSGGPSWISSERYDIDAKIEDSMAEAMQKLPPDQRAEQTRLLVQSLLADRFQLKVTHETKELPVYALVVAKGGPKLTPASDETPGPGGPNPAGAPPSGAGRIGFGGARGGGGGGGRTFMIGRGQLTLSGSPLSALANALALQPDVGRVVLDETGIKGNFDIALKWTPEGPTQTGGGDATQGSATAPLPDTSGPTIFTALQDQLGLKLESRKGPTDTIIINQIEKPSEN